ncbi:unnamed protein product [Miscanthus lutarioriparius]|uniref:Receptor kinase-like protein Xa21 n=1 Tax=Miscanthus lutarioriparius TaxID=422564 RepID=A0A811R791_9POAL|nr:unnamed protein product [Miscanthus lutarioriparius]
MLMLAAFLLLMSYGVGSIRCLTILNNNTTDMLMLSDFRGAITSDPQGTLSSWNSTTPYCQWKGVTCSLRHPGRVTVLNLGDQGLSGSISPSLGNLTFLMVLNLSQNSFSGELPDFVRLQRLEMLDLGTNMLTGTIPPKIGFLPKLAFLSLVENSLTGTIPPSLINATQLWGVRLHANQLQGVIPDQLWQLPNLRQLFLGENMLSGSISPDISNRSSLRALDLGSNMLGNALPANIGNIFPDLLTLNLRDNMLEGQIPASLGNASGLVYIDLSNNHFAGQIPISFGKLSGLHFIGLQQNKLEAKDTKSWEFLDALSNCTLLNALQLSQNQLQGAIPNSIGKLSPNLQWLALDTNNLLGTVPMSISYLSGLTTLQLQNNSLTGPIGEWVGNMTNLQGLVLNENNFIGPIPFSIGNLTRLEYLLLANNDLEAPIPPSLLNLSQLSELDLSYNNLQGNMFTQLSSTVTIYKISYNSLDGPIPTDIGNLNQLVELHLSSNKLSGEIPDSLGECQKLQILQIDHNFLSGNISMSLIRLKNLALLNLSHNNLSGSIPVALGDLKFLALLDLSYNHLYGEIPSSGVFENAASVSLSDNSGLCGGAVDLKMQPCPHVSRRRLTQYYMIRILIPIFGFMSLILLIYFLLTGMRKARESSPLQDFTGEQFPKVSYNDLAEATRNFSESNLLGRGSYGSVYRGHILKNKIEVAVKVLDLDMRGAEKSFFSECEALRRIQHRNLVPIITACSTVDRDGNVFKALVYEFMRNGNLDTWLHNNLEVKSPKHLNLTQRLSIAVNIADALDYLHHDSGKPIVHCDVKPSNILLDDDMTAHLGDFGIASFYVNSQLMTSTDSTTSAGIKGTIGYIAPEYAGGARVSTSGDVYSFGIVLLEMLTGKRPTDPMFENGANLVDFVDKSFPDQISDIIDAPIQEMCKVTTQGRMDDIDTAVHRCVLSMLQVALSCTCQLPKDRMDMREVASKMHAINMSSIKGK